MRALRRSGPALAAGALALALAGCGGGERAAETPPGAVGTSSVAETAPSTPVSPAAPAPPGAGPGTLPATGGQSAANTLVVNGTRVDGMLTSSCVRSKAEGDLFALEGTVSAFGEISYMAVATNAKVTSMLFIAETAPDSASGYLTAFADEEGSQPQGRVTVSSDGALHTFVSETADMLGQPIRVEATIDCG